MNYTHPLQTLFASSVPRVAGMSSGLGFSFGNPFESLSDFVAGLDDAFKDVVESISHAIEGILNAIKKILSALVKAIAPAIKAIAKALAEVVKFVASYALNAIDFSFELAQQIPIVGETFRLLDKYSGGFLTNIRNVMRLPFRALKGETISKQELLMAGLTILQVVMIAAGGPVAIGAWVGSVAGRAFCTAQTMSKDAKLACMAAFTIAGASVGAGYNASLVAGAKEGAFYTTAQQEAYKRARQQIAAQVCKKQSDPFACNLIVNAGFDIYEGQDAYEVITDGTKTYIRDRVSKEIKKEILARIPKKSPRIIYVQPGELPEPPPGIEVVDLRDETGTFVLVAAGLASVIFLLNG